MDYRTVKPFIKWAGGKSQLLNEIRKKYPEKIQRYCEPFVGGGAVLFDILANFHPEEVLINDINSELINTYIQIRDNAEYLIETLSDIQNKYWKMTSENRKLFYLEKRNQYNNIIKNKNYSNEEKACLFIFLNKTCFNGLYRVNKKGLFNVPIGSYKNPLICDTENLRLTNKLLQNVKIINKDYSQTDYFIDNKTFVYIDPPYRPINETSSFTAYSNSDFTDNEQIQLCRFINKITDRGAKIIASNSDPKNINTDDDFFDKLYCNYTVTRVSAKRMINSKGDSRGNINELLIYN